MSRLLLGVGGERLLVPPGSAILGAEPLGGTGQVGGAQIFLELLITGMGSRNHGINVARVNKGQH